MWRTSFPAFNNPASFTVDVQKKWSDKFHIIAYYYDEICKTVVADALTVLVEQKFQNDVHKCT